MNFIRELHSGHSLRSILLVVLVAFAVAISPLLATRAAAEGHLQGDSATSTAQQPETSRPLEPNLPFLFAVFIITWAAFFGYVFYLSLRQRDLRSEIEALKRALAQREEAENADSNQEAETQ